MSRISNNLNASELIIEKLIQLGAQHFVISPGSRSTPLTVAAARNDHAEKTVHFDERGAAFYALGLARSTGKPAVLICTSGTAVANYFPAMIEASMDNVPMIILSADRPPELIGVGANQAIYQENIYGRYPRWHGNLSPPDDGIEPDHLNSLLESMWSHSIGEYPGPVHLNCQFREPLLDEENHTGTVVPEPSVAEASHELSKHEIHSISSAIESAKRGLIILGRSVPKKDHEAILTLADRLKWPVLPDIQSTLRFQDHPNVINFFDLALLKDEIRTKKPEITLEFSGPFTSKRLLTYLNDETIYQVSINPTPETNDPNQQVDFSLQSEIAEAVHELDVSDRSDSTWLDLWKDVSSRIKTIQEQYFQSTDDLSEPAIHHTVSRMIPNDHPLFLANSMPIRDMEMFASISEFNGSIYSNRGASGIDGLLATSAGIARGSKKPVTAIIGDLAALHDLNSLALSAKSSDPIIYIVINNHGGGIFNFLPISEETDVFDEYFGTPHALSFKQASEMFGLMYTNPHNMSDFKHEYAEAIERDQTTLIEIMTDRYENHDLHKDIFQLIRES